MNFTKLGEDIGRSSILNQFISEFRYLTALSNAGRRTRVISKMTPNFVFPANFAIRFLRNLEEGWTRSLDQ